MCEVNAAIKTFGKRIHSVFEISSKAVAKQKLHHIHFNPASKNKPDYNYFSEKFYKKV